MPKGVSKRSETEMIAYALEVEPRLLPWMPELLSDFDELGSNADLIVAVLRDLGLPPSARVIDLGCGKGAIAVAIAKALGCRVEGIDLFEPFIASAVERATAADVSDLCSFQQADIRKMAGNTEPADAAVYAALGDVLGPLDHTVGVIRRFVHPGGFILISDDYVKEGGTSESPVSENRFTHQDALQRLQSFGDRLLREVVESSDPSQTYAGELAQIRRRAEQLVARHPEIEPALMRYLENQRQEYEYMAANVVPVTWILERSA